MIPAIFLVAFLTACTNTETPQTQQITVEQREASIHSAMQHLQAGRSMEALAITSILVDRDPTSAQSQEVHALALLAEGWRYDNSGDPKQGVEKRNEALNAYILACNQSTTPGLLQLSTAQLAHMLGDIPTATKYYTLAHENVINDARASFFLAQIELINSRWDTAKVWITESMVRNPNEPFALLSLALIEAQLGNASVAIELANKGCGILPEEPNLRFIQARVFRLAGRPEQALEILLALPKTIQDSEMCRGEFDSCLDAIKNAE